MKTHKSQRGFTLMEVVTVVAVIGILAAIAVFGYESYVSRARASEVLLKYDALRSGMGARVASGNTDDCDALARSLGNTNLDGAGTSLAYAFEAVAGGFRPVLNICARADQHGGAAVKVARGAHDTMQKTGNVERGAVLTDAVVSFSLPLTAADKAVCKTAAPVQPTCGGGQPAGPAGSTVTAQAPAQAPVQAPASAAAPAATAPATPEQAAEQSLAQALQRPKNADDARAITMLAASRLPSSSLTAAVLGASPEGREIASRCAIGPPDSGPCADEYLGSCQDDFPGMMGECFVAQVCVKTAGICTGATPEMKRILDESVRRIEQWFSTHPNCTAYLQDNC